MSQTPEKVHQQYVCMCIYVCMCVCLHVVQCSLGTHYNTVTIITSAVVAVVHNKIQMKPVFALVIKPSMNSTSI